MAFAASDEFYLTKDDDPDQAAVLSARSARVTVGRAPSCTIVVNTPAVSRVQCVVTFDAQDSRVQIVLEDTSTYGTYVNGDRLGKGVRRQLKVGDAVSNIGQDNTQSDGFTLTLHRKDRQMDVSGRDMFNDSSSTLDHSADRSLIPESPDAGSKSTDVFRKPADVKIKAQQQRMTTEQAAPAFQPSPTSRLSSSVTDRSASTSLFGSLNAVPRPVSRLSGTDTAASPASKPRTPLLLVGKRLDQTQAAKRARESGSGAAVHESQGKRAKTEQSSLLDYMSSNQSQRRAGRAASGADEKNEQPGNAAAARQDAAAASQTRRATRQSQRVQEQSAPKRPAAAALGRFSAKQEPATPIERYSQQQPSRQVVREDEAEQTVPDSQPISDEELRAVARAQSSHHQIMMPCFSSNSTSAWLSTTRTTNTQLDMSVCERVPLKTTHFGDVQLPDPDKLSDKHWNYIHNCSVSMPLVKKEPVGGAQHNDTSTTHSAGGARVKNVKKFVKAAQGYHRHKDGRLPQIIETTVNYRSIIKELD